MAVTHNRDGDLLARARRGLLHGKKIPTRSWSRPYLLIEKNTFSAHIYQASLANAWVIDSKQNSLDQKNICSGRTKGKLKPTFKPLKVKLNFIVPDFLVRLRLNGGARSRKLISSLSVKRQPFIGYHINRVCRDDPLSGQLSKFAPRIGCCCQCLY